MTEFENDAVRDDLPVREFALKGPAVREALEKLGIDTCCGGGRPLREAAAAAGVSRAALAAALAMPENVAAGFKPAVWLTRSSGEIIDYILQRYHASLDEMLPRLDLWFGRTLAAHGDAHGRELQAYRQLFDRLRQALVPHLREEERNLFPVLRAGKVTFSALEWVATLEADHDEAGRLLRQLHAATAGYRVPDYACPTVELLFRGLRKLESELHDHIFLENNVLFPRAVVPCDAPKIEMRG